MMNDSSFKQLFVKQITLNYKFAKYSYQIEIIFKQIFLSQ